jgi:hypothetical protein
MAIALIALAFPAAAAARKNAWQLASLSGTYEYHSTNPNPMSCTAGRSVLLSRDYTETWRADSFPRAQYAAKYFPVFRGPETNGAGQKAHLVHTGTLTEKYRTFAEDTDGNCTQGDQTCTKQVTAKGSRTVFLVTHKRPGSPPVVQWQIDFTNSIPDCTPRGDPDLEQALRPDSDASPLSQSTTNSAFTRKRPRFAVSGRGFSAEATLKKLVIPDGCADTKPQRQFVCK